LAEENHIYKKMFGLPRVINLGDPYSSFIGGGVMPREVVEAMDAASKEMVHMHDLLRKSGEMIAKICHAEAGLVTSGASSALTLASAACMTGKDLEKMRQLPDSTGLKNEIIVQHGHATNFLSCLRASGAKIVEVGCSYLPVGVRTIEEFEKKPAREYYPIIEVGGGERKKYYRIFAVLPDHIENAINEKTAAIYYLTDDLSVRSTEKAHSVTVSLEEVLRIGKKHGVPVIVDAAYLLPPVSNLWRFIEMGADLVVFSGGKAILGPNDTGILVGRKDLVEAAALQNNPHYRFIIGRGFKVSKEQIVGLVVALQKFAKMNEADVIAEDVAKLKYFVEQLKDTPGIKLEIIEPLTMPVSEAIKRYPDEFDKNGVYLEPIPTFPCVRMTLDERALGMKSAELNDALWNNDPRIYLGLAMIKFGVYHFYPRQVTQKDWELVIKKLRDVLTKKARKKL